jgi:ubiquinone/menaquinone biosynthesis C-methylase UbiE
MARTTDKRRRPRTSWDPLATWYDGWMGQQGSIHHRQLAIPALLDLLQPQPGEHILDIGAGQGVLAPYLAERGAHYTGVEIGPRLVRIARARHGQHGTFIQADARKLDAVPELRHQYFDAVVFLLSIQDMQPLDAVLRSASQLLCTDGRLVILMTHPCFRVPRQSGWGWDEGRQSVYRRVDRYLTPLDVPMKAYPGRTGVSLSFHRPLSLYVNTLAAYGLLIERLCETAVDRIRLPSNSRDHLARAEIPLFLGLRACKVQR